MDRFTVVDDYTGVQRDYDGKWVKYEEAAAEKRRADEAEARLAMADLYWQRHYLHDDGRAIIEAADAEGLDAALSASRALAVVEGRIHTITGDDVSVVADLPGQIGSYPRTATVVVLDASGKE